jgi:hypothetical protein
MSRKAVGQAVMISGMSANPRADDRYGLAVNSVSP